MHGHALLQVDDAHAAYPVTVDPFMQQGLKLTPSSSTGSFGLSVALSSDGNTAFVGAPNDSGTSGAAFVFTRSGSTWTQQGSKLVPSDPGNAGNNNFGESVALSADGSTALIGAPADSPDTLAEGAAWVFTRSGSTWSQQSSRLSPSDETNGFTLFGWSVSLSSDGNTALIGGPSDNTSAGAAWIYTRSGSTWAQGSKLLPNDESGAARFGFSVAISGDGATALIGGPHDTSDTGAAWPFVLSGGIWSQQGSKLTGSGESASGEFGAAVALSSDGSTAMVGGASIDAAPSQSGAAWGFARSGSSWAQQGSEIVPSDESGLGDFGLAVALSSDGNTALIGGPDDAGSVGAVWAFTRSGSAWAQQGPKLTGGAERGSGSFGAGVALASDAATALIGGPADSSSNGAAWPFVATGITVTPASFGEAISADTTGGAFTDLTGPVLTENAPGLIGTGTVVLNAPAGFAFDASAAPACRGTSGLTASVTAQTAATITCTVTAASSGSAGTLTFIGVTIQPTAGTPLAAGSITETGTASLSGASGGYGTLAEVAGAASKLGFTAQPAGAASGTALSAMPVVTIQDQFANPTPSESPVTVAISAGTGAAGATLSGTTSATGPVASFGGLSIDRSGTAYTLQATSGGLTAATSGAFDVTGVGSVAFSKAALRSGGRSPLHDPTGRNGHARRRDDRNNVDGDHQPRDQGRNGQRRGKLARNDNGRRGRRCRFVRRALDRYPRLRLRADRLGVGDEHRQRNVRGRPRASGRRNRDGTDRRGCLRRRGDLDQPERGTDDLLRRVRPDGRLRPADLSDRDRLRVEQRARERAADRARSGHDLPLPLRYHQPERDDVRARRYLHDRSRSRPRWRRRATTATPAAPINHPRRPRRRPPGSRRRCRTSRSTSSHSSALS